MRELRIWPDPILSQVSEPVENFDDGDLSDLISDLLDVIYSVNARGLAAPEAGVLKRVFVMDLGWKDGVRVPRAFVNPTILETSSDTKVMEEICVCIPNQPRRIRRPAKVEIGWQDSDGAQHRDWFDGVEAMAVLHNIDHLDGRTILDLPEAS